MTFTHLFNGLLLLLPCRRFTSLGSDQTSRQFERKEKV